MTRAIVAALLLLAGVPAEAKTSESVARLGQTVRLGNVRVTPLEIIEDSRCPRLVTCVWRGRLRITAAVGGDKVTLDNGVAVPIREGRLTLVGADQRSQRGETIAPRSYRFRFRLER